MFNSQENQDKYLEENIFKGHKYGFFVDIGAHDGVSINNTLYFESKNNWSGICAEPIPEIFDKLKINRHKCINLNLAIDNNDGNTEFIHNKGHTEMLSGIKNHYDPRHSQRLQREIQSNGGSTQIINVPTKKLSTIFKENNIKNVNYLSIDVEGGEFPVIKSIDFDNVFIDVIGFENNYSDTVTTNIINYLSEKGYKTTSYRGCDVIMIHNNSVFNKNI